MKAHEELHPYAAGIETVRKALKPLGIDLLGIERMHYDESISDLYVKVTVELGYSPKNVSGSQAELTSEQS